MKLEFEENESTVTFIIIVGTYDEIFLCQTTSSRQIITRPCLGAFKFDVSFIY